jgi:hypothetical protein
VALLELTLGLPVLLIGALLAGLRRPAQALVTVVLVAGLAGAVLGQPSASPPSPTGSAGSLTPGQLGELAGRAGFGSSSGAVAVAVAEAESGGRPGARHVNDDGSVDRGLWQINARAHPEVSDSCAYDPACSAQAAYAISDHGANWTPWTTYKTGAYLAFMPGGA